jgi:hypothetical protein
VKRPRVRCTERWVDGDRNMGDLRDRKVHGEITESAPRKEPRLTAHRSTCSIRELFGRETSQVVNVSRIYNRVERNRRVPG